MSARLCPAESMYRPTAHAWVELVTVTPSSSSNVPLSALGMILQPAPVFPAESWIAAEAGDVARGPTPMARRDVRTSAEVSAPALNRRRRTITDSFAPDSEPV